MQRVNYDDITHLYDEPSRDHVADPNLIEYITERPELEKAEIRVLDIGCGTGNLGRLKELLRLCSAEASYFATNGNCRSGLPGRAGADQS